MKTWIGHFYYCWISLIDIYFFLFSFPPFFDAVMLRLLSNEFSFICYPTENDDRLTLQLKDMALAFSWPVGRIKESLSSLGGPFPSTPTSCSTASMKLILALVEEQNIPEAKISLASGVTAFLWLYTSILGYVVTLTTFLMLFQFLRWFPPCTRFKPATVVVTSELPLGSGLGSSAALCVAFSAALLACSDSVNVDMKQQGWLIFGESELELLNKWAFEGEKLIHGKPSGIDNTVSTYGK
jgi:mevalonate kinase